MRPAAPEPHNSAPVEVAGDLPALVFTEIRVDEFLRVGLLTITKFPAVGQSGCW